MMSSTVGTSTIDDFSLRLLYISIHIIILYHYQLLGRQHFFYDICIRIYLLGNLAILVNIYILSRSLRIISTDDEITTLSSTLMTIISLLLDQQAASSSQVV